MRVQSGSEPLSTRPSGVPNGAGISLSRPSWHSVTAPCSCDPCCVPSAKLPPTSVIWNAAAPAGGAPATNAPATTAHTNPTDANGRTPRRRLTTNPHVGPQRTDATDATGRGPTMLPAVARRRVPDDRLRRATRCRSSCTAASGCRRPSCRRSRPPSRRTWRPRRRRAAARNWLVVPALLAGALRLRPVGLRAGQRGLGTVRAGRSTLLAVGARHEGPRRVAAGAAPEADRPRAVRLARAGLVDEALRGTAGGGRVRPVV